MRAKKPKPKSKDDPVYLFRPIEPEEYPEFVESELFTYYRFWCLPSCIVYEKYRGQIRLSYYILPDQKEIFSFDKMVEYAENHHGPKLCHPQLQQ